MSLTRKRRRPLRLHWAVALMPPPSPQVETGRRTQHRRCPPAYHVRSFCTTPPPLLYAHGPVKGGGVVSPQSFDSTLSSSLSLSSSSFRALTYYVGHRHLSQCDVSSLSLRRRLYRHATTTIAAPTPDSLRLSRASSWLLHRHLSCCTSAYLVVPTPLSLLCHLSCCAATSLLVAPHLRQLVVASPTILTCHRLSCRVGHLATSLFVPQSLSLPPLSLHHSLFGS